MGGQQIALDAQQAAAASGEMEHGLDAHVALHQVGGGPGRHAHARHGRVGHVDDVGAGLGQQVGAGQQLVGVEAARRVHFHADHKLAGGQAGGQLGGLAGGRQRLSRRSASTANTAARWGWAVPGASSSASRMAAI